MPNQRPEKKGLSAHWAVERVDHLFAQLARYTRFVLFGKWFLMLFAIGLIVVLIGLPLVSKDRSGIRVSFVDRTGSAPTTVASPVMSNPEFRGSDEKGQQFQVNGTRAVQVTANQIHIEQVNGKLFMTDGGIKTLTANRAEYNQTSKILDLFGDVTVTDEKGYRFVTQAATVDTNTMDVDGHVAVAGDGSLGNILASGFQIRDSGDHIIFTSSEKQLHVHIDRDADHHDSAR